MGFKHQITARFYEIDRAGIVFYGRFYEYCHAALEELLAAMFGHAEAIFVEKGFGMPLVHSEADYKKPTRMGDRLSIDVSVKRVGKRSITFEYLMTDDDGDERCTVRLVHCFVDMASFDAMAVPADFLAGLQRVGLIDPS